MDASLRGIEHPPVAWIFSDATDPATIDPEDYRRFYVEFAENATGENVHTAFRLVVDALTHYREVHDS